MTESPTLPFESRFGIVGAPSFGVPTAHLSFPILLPFPPFSSGAFKFVVGGLHHNTPAISSEVMWGLQWEGFSGPSSLAGPLELQVMWENTPGVPERRMEHPPAGVFPATSSGELKWQGTIDNGNLYTFIVKGAVYSRAPSDSLLSARTDFIQQTIQEPFPNNVRLYFSRSGRELWSASRFLSSASPYFKMALSSGFAEAELGVDVVELPGAAESALNDDSDEEGDGDGEADADAKPSLPPPPKPLPPHHTIKIRDSSYRTYRAVLSWLLSGHIEFAPLSSTFVGPSPDDPFAPTRASFISAASLDQPTLPLPVSPKSVYRLAHFLEIPDLQALALETIWSQISLHNIAAELFSNLSGCYEEVQEMLVEYAVRDWPKVKACPGMLKAQEEMADCKWGGVVLMKLAMRLG